MSAGPLLAVGAGGNRVPAFSPLVQEEAPVLIRMPILSSVSCLVKEEPDPCDSHVPVVGSGPCGGYPTARSPVMPVLQKASIPEASENWVPESPVGCTKEEWLLEEAEAPGQLDTTCVPSGDERALCMEAEEGRSSALAVSPGVSGPPPWHHPWAYGGGSAQDTRASSAVGADSSPRRPWASSEQEIAFQLQECQSVLEEISRSLCAVEGIDQLHMEKWREQIAELQKATKPPSTYVAVVGNTGAGKSSLLNALRRPRCPPRP
ncbi:PREDICTED: uncharacterized protein LOC107124819 [Gekko japonicus]|uniref:Uncharacterized protein LOC107124819 n=1 Tax=Gekko japonicus TaxID=146911 RepID=A0ABM1LCX7_GEKJA|nr:PREDICTED: uncharacterized protein LOC107124819 [Gekko japonicus]